MNRTWKQRIVPVVAAGVFLATTVLPIAASTVEQLERQVAQQQQRLRQLTGHRFDRPVSVRLQDSEGFQEYLEHQWEEMGPDFVEQMGRKLTLLGLLDPEEDLVKSLTRLYEQQAGAYYDPDNRSINVLSPDLPPMAMNFLLFHELIHAYQDDRYNLREMRSRAWGSENFDHQMAMVFLIEGHANFLAYLDLIGQRRIEPEALRNPVIERTFGTLAGLSNLSPDATRAAGAMLDEPVTDPEVIEETPLIVHRILTDPYFVGPQAWLYHVQSTGWPQAEEWLGNEQPVSTREILIGRSSEVPAVEAEGGTPLGLYLFLRWVDGFPSVPDWTRDLRGDYAWLSEDGERLTWLLEFSGQQSARTAREKITELLNRKNLDKREQPAAVEYRDQERCASLETNGSRLRLKFSMRTEPGSAAVCWWGNNPS